MNEIDLIGYVLDLMEFEEQQVAERQLAASPELLTQAQRLQHWLSLLALDAESDPPEDLHQRTWDALSQFELGASGWGVAAVNPDRLVANAQPAQQLYVRNRVDFIAPGVHGPAAPSRWHLRDILAISALALVLAALIPPAVVQARNRAGIMACQDNLRKFHECLRYYAHEHAEQFPALEVEGPRAHAGVFVLLLRHAGTWTDELSVVCPGNRSSKWCSSQDWPTLEQWCSWATARDSECRRQYLEWSRRLSGCYAYYLGYWNTEQHLCGLTLRDEGCLPILADRPPRSDEDPNWLTNNSPNHAGLGQNVLYVAGHVKFQRCRRCGHVGDDIYINRNRRLAAGCDRFDSVLAPSEVTPLGPGILLADRQ
jgi:hypothetical protein